MRKSIEFLLKDKVAPGKIEFRPIDGLTIENRVKGQTRLSLMMYLTNSKNVM
jgi:hypothetical protein